MSQVTGICEYCGGTTTAKYRSQLKRFCSHACSNAYKWKCIRPRATYRTVVCAQCGAEVQIQESDHRLKEKQEHFFCSVKCSGAYQKSQHSCTCCVCGAKFWRGQSKYKTCSKDCHLMNLRFMSYKRMYDPDITMRDFLDLYADKNPFVWAADKSAYLRKYTSENRETLNKQRLAYTHSSPVIAYRVTMHKKIQVCFSHNREFPADIATIVGCDIKTFRAHIFSLLSDGMTEDNYGEWQLDHKVPLASAQSIDDVNRLSHYTNYQPLWEIDNQRKGAKIH